MELTVKPSDIARPRPDCLQPVLVNDPGHVRTLMLVSHEIGDVICIGFGVLEGKEHRSRTLVISRQDEAWVDRAIGSIIVDEVESARTADYKLRIHTTHERIRSALSQAVSAIPQLTWFEASQANRDEAHFLQEIHERAHRYAWRKAAPEVVATDASKRTGKRGAGLGVFIAGRLAAVEYVADCSSVLEGELLAIALAMNEVQTRRVVIQSDSLQAVELLNTVRDDSGLRDIPRDCPARVRHVIDHVLSLSKDHEVEFQWVRGHGDHPGNRTADRLAVLARRSASAQCEAATIKAIMNNIVAEEMGIRDGVSFKVRNRRAQRKSRPISWPM